MDLFNKLLMMRQLKFEEGKISLFNQKVCLAPGSMLREFTNFMLNKPEIIPDIYEHMRLAFDEGWANPVQKEYGLKSTDFFRWLIDLSNTAGWGKSKLMQFDERTYTGIFRTYNSIVGEAFKGKSHDPVCHIWRGLTAGGLTSAYNREMDWVEISCLGKGDAYCEFLFKPRELMKQSTDELFKKQLPIYQ